MLVEALLTTKGIPSGQSFMNESTPGPVQLLLGDTHPSQPTTQEAAIASSALRSGAASTHLGHPAIPGVSRSQWGRLIASIRQSGRQRATQKGKDQSISRESRCLCGAVRGGAGALTNLYHAKLSIPVPGEQKHPSASRSCRKLLENQACVWLATLGLPPLLKASASKPPKTEGHRFDEDRFHPRAVKSKGLFPQQ